MTAIPLHSVDIDVPPDNHCEPLRALVLQTNQGEQRFEMPRQPNAQFFEQFAQALQRASEQGLAPEVLTEAGRAEGRHPFSWMCVTENGGFKRARQCHEFYLWRVEGQFELCFEHGAFGYRRELHATLAEAFNRLALLVTRKLTWRQFGDLRSRQTLLEKGQFYWQDPSTGRDVPVDNFVFRATDGFELRQSGVSRRSVLGLSGVGEDSTHEWFDGHSDGLRRMADILGGRVDLPQFGTVASPGRYEQAPGRLTDAGEPYRLTQGQFYVESIYRSRDVHPAPVLTFRTGEGVEARLQVEGGVWRVRGRKPRQAWRIVRFSATEAHLALELWARVLETGLQALKGSHPGEGLDA